MGNENGLCRKRSFCSPEPTFSDLFLNHFWTLKIQTQDVKNHFTSEKFLSHQTIQTETVRKWNLQSPISLESHEFHNPIPNQTKQVLAKKGDKTIGEIKQSGREREREETNLGGGSEGCHWLRCDQCDQPLCFARQEWYDYVRNSDRSLVSSVS